MEPWSTVIAVDMQRKSDLGISLKAKPAAFADGLNVTMR